MMKNKASVLTIMMLGMLLASDCTTVLRPGHLFTACSGLSARTVLSTRRNFIESPSPGKSVRTEITTTVPSSRFQLLLAYAPSPRMKPHAMILVDISHTKNTVKTTSSTYSTVAFVVPGRSLGCS